MIRRSALVALLFLAAPLAAHVTLVGPNGRERLAAGSIHTITWSNDIPHTTLFWRLSYSVSGAQGPWLPIASNLPPGNLAYGAIHTYAWTVPATFSNTVRVRVVQDNAGYDYRDISDDDLSIVAPAATFTALGQGCGGSAGVPTLGASAGQPPRLGATFGFTITNVPATSTTVCLLIGFRTRPAIDLAVIGMPACVLRVRPSAVQTANVSGGQATWSIAIPNTATLIGGSLVGQAFVMDPAAGNALGATLSNAGEGVIGS